MTDDLPDRALPRETVERMVHAVRPEWRVRDATLAERGHTSVHHVTVEDADAADGEYVLKASPDGGAYGIRTEARLLALVGEHTSIPVPRLVGAVDAQDDLRTPFLVMERAAGTALPPREVGALSDAALRRVARETGAHLAALHVLLAGRSDLALDATDAFGYVGCQPTEPLRGGRPRADGADLVVTGSAESWPALVREWADDELDRLGDTRFADLAPRLRVAIDAELDALREDGPFTPALARVDHGLHNLLVEPGTGRATSVLDWAFTLAATPAYDLACVEFVLAGAAVVGLSDVPDRRALVRSAMLDGYRERAGDVPEEFRDHRACYDLLMCARSANHLAAGVTHVPDDRVDEVADWHRAEARSLLDEESA